MTDLILIVFALTYLGMAVGFVPGLKLDRSGIALLAVVILVAAGAMQVDKIGAAVDLPTLMLLFALMIVSAQFGEAGFYDWVAGKLAGAGGPPWRLLLLVVVVAGALSAVLANDIIAFAMAPVLAAGTRRRGLDPRPFLVALAGACNAGSAMTVIGNPQNILIGQVGHLDFWRFISACAPAGLAALAIVFGTVMLVWRRHLSEGAVTAYVSPHPFDRWQTGKGVVAILALAIIFATHIPRDVGALAVAGCLLASRKHHSRSFLVAVDWPLLLMIACLFIVTSAFSSLGFASQGIAWLAAHNLMPVSLDLMTPMVMAAGNTIGNVPATILILSVWQHPPEGAMYGLALLSTLAGNLLIVGSLANIIVAERAAAAGERLGFLDHAKSGIPMTILSIIVAAVWLWLAGWMPLI